MFGQVICIVFVQYVIYVLICIYALIFNGKISFLK